MSDKPVIYDENYPSRRLGDKWNPIVLIILGKGMKRFGELQRWLPDVSKKTLTQTLRTLEGDGLIKRVVHAQVPPRVDYNLTPLGQSFLEPVMGLCRWSPGHTADLDAVQACRKKSLRRKRLPPEGQME